MPNPQTTNNKKKSKLGAEAHFSVIEGLIPKELRGKKLKVKMTDKSSTFKRGFR